MVDGHHAAAGRSLEQVILSANPLRLAAVAQWIEVYPDAPMSADGARRLESENARTSRCLR